MGLLFLFQAHAFTQPAFLFFWMFPPLAISRDLGFSVELWSECVSPVCTYLSSQEHRRLSCIELIPAGRASWKRRYAQEPVSGERWEGPPWSGSGVAKAKGLGTVERQFAWGSAAEGGCEVGGHGNSRRAASQPQFPHRSWSWQYSPRFSFSAPSSLPGRAPFLRGCPPPLMCMPEGKPWSLLPQEVSSPRSRRPRQQQGLHDPWIWLPSQNWLWGTVAPEERSGLGFIGFTTGPSRAHWPGFLEPDSFLFHQPLKCELFQEMTSYVSQRLIFFVVPS